MKNAILFPDVMNSQLQELLEKQGSELKQAKLVIPALQQQVSSLTGQLQNLAEDLAEVYITCILVCMIKLLSFVTKMQVINIRH